MEDKKQMDQRNTWIGLLTFKSLKYHSDPVAAQFSLNSLGII